MKNLFSYFDGGSAAAPAKQAARAKKDSKSRPATSAGEKSTRRSARAASAQPTPPDEEPRPSSAPSKRKRKVVQQLSDDSDDDDAVAVKEKVAPPAATRKRATPTPTRAASSVKPPSAARISARVADTEKDAQDKGDRRQGDPGSGTKKKLFKKVEPSQSTPDADKDGDDQAAPQTSQPRAKFNPYKPREPPPQRGKKPRPVGKPNCLQDKVFVITGVLDSLERDECADLCKEYGARVVGSVSGKTTHVIVGSDAGESKLNKARSLKVPQISEDDLFEMINKTAPQLPMTSKTQSQPTREMEIEPKVSRQESAAKAVAAATTGLNAISPAKTFSSRAKVDPAETLPKPNLKKDRTGELWVDKYKPTKSSDLCGNPGLVKELRLWLMDWKRNFLKPQTEDARGKKRKSGGEVPRAALLAGPPGIGKTTLARIISQETGFEPHEFNASDTRSKKLVQSTVASVTLNAAMEKYCVVDSARQSTATEGQVLIMDECDGMSAGDRGGIQELIKMIKETKVPIICIANDDMHTKVRSLANSCLKLKFRRPMASQCRRRLMEIAATEKLVMDTQTAEKIADSCHGDIRQMINCLQAWSSSGNKISYQGVVKKFEVEGKSFENQSIFDVYKKFFEPSKSSVADRMDNFFVEADLNPLFVQENYLLSGSVNDLGRLADAAEAISDGDVVAKTVRVNGRWDLMPVQALMSCVRAGSVAQGYMTGRVNFPAWLGKNSTTGKAHRLIRDLDMRSKLQKTGSVRSLRLDYLEIMYKHMSNPLKTMGADGIQDAITNMEAYLMSREDFDAIEELLISEPLSLPTQLKSAFTRQYNSSSHKLTGVSNMEGGKAKKAKAPEEPTIVNGDDIVDPELEEQEVDGDSDDGKADATAYMKPKKKARTSKAASKKTGSGKASRGSGKSSRGSRAKRR